MCIDNFIVIGAYKMLQYFMSFNYAQTPIKIKKLREALNDNQVDNEYQNIFKVCGIEDTPLNEASVFKNILLASSPIKNSDLKLSEIKLNRVNKYSWLILEIPTTDFEELSKNPYDLKAEVNDSLNKILRLESTYISLIRHIIQVGYYFPNSPKYDKNSSKFALFKSIQQVIEYKVTKTFKFECRVSFYQESFLNPYLYDDYIFYGNYFELRSFTKLYESYADEKRPYTLNKGAKPSLYEMAGNRHLDEEAYRWVVYILQSEAGKNTLANKTREDLLYMAKAGNDANISNSLRKLEEAIIDIISDSSEELCFTAYNIHKISVFLSDDKNSQLEESRKKHTPITIKTASKYLKQYPYLIHSLYIKNAKIRWKVLPLYLRLKKPSKNFTNS